MSMKSNFMLMKFWLHEQEVWFQACEVKQDIDENYLNKDFYRKLLNKELKGENWIELTLLLLEKVL